MSILDACASGRESFLYKTENGAAVFGYGFGPGEAAHLGEVDAAEAESRDQDVDAVPERLVCDGGYRLGNRFRAVRFGPAMLYLGVGFVDGHLEGGMGHGEGDELLPVLGARQ